MKKQMVDPNIRNEESRTLKWFLIVFYIISISFDLIYKIIAQYIPQLKNESPDKLIFWIYLIMFALIPIAIYLNKKQKQHLIKYIYFISYTTLTILNDIVTFISSPSDYQSGNAVEIYWLLLAPVFVSKRFVMVVSIGLILKYIVVGLIIKAPIVLLGILLIAILSFLSFILLYRFESYVKAVKTSYDQQLIGIVKGVIATLELKDPYTRGHSERVASYALVLAKETGKFRDEELKSFNYACLLHDIGKIHIPDQILMKPTSLTKEEYEIIKSHTNVGAEAVSKVVGLDNSIEVIRSHHERWDGRGYPDQLKGEEIPYLARIAAIADAFDAMTSTRSYRSALTIDEAYKRILEGKGSQFDPELVEEFQKAFPIWRKIHNTSNQNLVISQNKINEVLN
ncbi:HD-GYP domain-containing protein [Bacillaceae bacterium C204]|uniref:HD-GYP domain-containing protein n=1 Tax=Neobacillus sp. 204 TaxID=3383351 RepID=UPI00397D846E